MNWRLGLENFLSKLSDIIAQTLKHCLEGTQISPKLMTHNPFHDFLVLYSPVSFNFYFCHAVQLPGVEPGVEPRSTAVTVPSPHPWSTREFPVCVKKKREKFGDASWHVKS